MRSFISSLFSKHRPVIIAHRGASGYLPEHTLASKAMAHAMNPHYLEQDVAVTKDNRAIVIHDHYLDTVSNVAELYPKRKRKDGRYYVIDFTLKELKKLRLHERINLQSGEAVFPMRFPLAMKQPILRIHTLEEEIEFIQGMNISRGLNIGIYTELKAPKFHLDEGKDIISIVLDIVHRYGYRTRQDACYIQCFDPRTLKTIRHEKKSDLKLVQLIAKNEWNETPDVDYTPMCSTEGLQEIATYADAIGPWINQIVTLSEKDHRRHFSSLIKDAHKAGLQVHPYTVRRDSLPDFAEKHDLLLKFILCRMKADGIFTDFPDLGVSFLKKRGCYRMPV